MALPALGARVVQELQARTSGQRLVAGLDPSLPEILSDEGKIHQILSNLVENAMKYSPEETTVRIGATREPAGVILSVTDEGEGVLAEHRDRIFERFFQVDFRSTRRVGGPGLGLYISRDWPRSWGDGSGSSGLVPTGRTSVSSFRWASPRASTTPDGRQVAAG